MFSECNSSIMSVVVAFAVPIVPMVVAVEERMEVAAVEVLTTFCFLLSLLVGSSNNRNRHSFVIIIVVVVAAISFSHSCF